MKRLTTLLLILTLGLPVISAEVDWSKYDNIDNAWDGQKIITNKQFEETMAALEEKKNKKLKKQREKAIKKEKGSSLHSDMDAHKDNIESQTPMDEINEFMLVNIPMDFLNNGKMIEKGFYKISGEKKEDGVYIQLFQARQLITEIKAVETKDDFNEEFIQFAKILPHNESKMKIIFGSLDFNAYTYINVIESPYYNY